MARPVFDPALPAEIREKLGDAAEELLPASAPDPTLLRRAQARRGLRGLGTSLCLFGAAAATAAVGRSLDTRSLLVLSVALFVAGAGVAGGAGIRLVELLFPGNARRRLARRHHGGYYLPEDFRGSSRVLYTRVTNAVDQVLRSALCRAGLLDAVRMRVFLSGQEWDLVSALFELDHTEGVLRGASANSEAVRGERAALVERIEALCAYAQQVAELDRGYSSRLASSRVADAAAASAVGARALDELVDELAGVRHLLAEPDE